VHGGRVNRGRLIAFEGLDGSGKSTQISQLAESLRKAGHDPVVTAEPTRGDYGLRIRAMALGRSPPIAPEEELRWFVEDRREHVAACIGPALAAGRTVLTDRYFLSTVAYQGANGLDPSRILAQSEAEFPIPDLVLLLELDVETALARVRARGARVESAFETRERLERVARIFGQVERAYLTRIDANCDADAVALAIAAQVRARLDLP
jgi:dTMP kinase